MGITLNPREKFVIVRQLADHTDSSTYYVRAVVRNSRTDEVIDTVNLTDRTTGRFTQEYQVPADVSGLGYFVDITTSVYSDSGYTTKASTYGDENETYLIYDRTRGSGGGGGFSGGSDVNYKKIKKLMEEVVSEIKPSTLNVEKTDLSQIEKKLLQIHREVKAIEFPEQKKVDLSPVLMEVQSVGSKVDAIDIPKPEKLDLSPVMKILEDSEFVEYKESVEKLNKLFTELFKMINDNMPEVKDHINEIKDKMGEFLYIVSSDKSKTSEKQEKDDAKFNRASRLLTK